ncbi:MAG: hypothetical protein LBD14_03710 [Puniceicoccales bacterium]|nr:hypothetical protein [Puniceicoccales bacterium]
MGSLLGAKSFQTRARAKALRRPRWRRWGPQGRALLWFTSATEGTEDLDKYTQRIAALAIAGYTEDSAEVSLPSDQAVGFLSINPSSPHADAMSLSAEVCRWAPIHACSS